MGTNYYLRRKLSINERQEIIDDIIFCRYDDARDKLPKDIHIGKKSCGWKFLWNANRFKNFKPSKDSIMSFLRSGQIIDEYGRWLTYEEFLDVISRNIDDGYDLESYYKSNPQERPRDFWFNKVSAKTMVEEFGLDINNFNEFYIDNLRFTTDDEFS